jgi:hypothetical protein
VLALEDLERFLVDADHDRILRWMQVEPAHRLGLAEELWVLALEPLPHPMWAKVFEAKDASDLARADRLSGPASHGLGERAIGPHVSEWRWRLASLGSSAGKLHQLAPRRE